MMSCDFTRLKGVFPLVSMAFTEGGAVDYAAFERIVHFVCDSGADGVGLWGMMSEYYKLGDFERDRLVSVYFRAMDCHETTKLVSVTDWCTELAVEHAREYQDRGADFLMLLPPFYYQPSVGDVIRHIRQVAGAVQIPVLVQYAPQSTGMYLDERVIISMAEEYPNMAFKIEHNPQLEFLEQFLALKPDLKVMSGYAGLDMPELLSAGVRGVMPGCSFTELYVEIYRRYACGDAAGAQTVYRRLERYLQTWMTSVERLIAVDKVVLQRRGVSPVLGVRHPACALGTEELAEIDAFLQEFAEFLPQYD